MRLMMSSAASLMDYSPWSPPVRGLLRALASPCAPHTRFRTRVITDGVIPSPHIDYKGTCVKQYHKKGQALRTERATSLRSGTRSISRYPIFAGQGEAANRLRPVLNRSCSVAAGQEGTVFVQLKRKDLDRSSACKMSGWSTRAARFRWTIVLSGLEDTLARYDGRSNNSGE